MIGLWIVLGSAAALALLAVLCAARDEQALRAHYLWLKQTYYSDGFGPRMPDYDEWKKARK